MHAQGGAFPSAPGLTWADVLAGGLVALLLAFWGLRLAHEAKSDTQSMHASSSVLTDPTPRAVSRMARKPADPAHARLDASADLLTFIAAVRHDPVPGGHYLALKAYDFCAREARQTLEALNEPQVNTNAWAIHPKQRDAQQALLNLCAGFSPRRFADLDFHALAEEGLRQGDGKLVTYHALERASAGWERMDAAERAGVHLTIASVLAAGDAELLIDLAQELEVLMNVATLSLGARTLSSSESLEVLDGVRLLACERGAACTRESAWHLTLACASAGDCETPQHVATPSATRGLSLLRQTLVAGQPLGVVQLRERVY
jgi:hypothetical protein